MGAIVSNKRLFASNLVQTKGLTQMATVKIKNVQNNLYIAADSEGKWLYANASQASGLEFEQVDAGSGLLSYRAGAGQTWMTYRNTTGAVKLESQYAWAVEEVHGGKYVFKQGDGHEFMGISAGSEELYVVGANNPGSPYCQFVIETIG